MQWKQFVMYKVSILYQSTESTPGFSASYTREAENDNLHTWAPAAKWKTQIET